jgi:RimJ/RimL family protein N-acetyltransferase
MRIVQEMQSYGLTLRPVQADDCHLIWQWANDSTTRASSFSTQPISWERHLAWFTTKLADPQSRYYLALDATATPIGQIRYQIDGQFATVSVSLAPDQRGRGYGHQIIWLASQQLFENTSVKLIHAYVKPDNIASMRAFTRAGFTDNGITEMRGHSAVHFVLRKIIYNEQLS